MRKLILAATGLVCLTGVSYFIGSASGEGPRAADDVPHKIGLIDVNYIFQNYDKVKVLRQELLDEMQTINADIEKKAQRLQSLIGEMKQLTEGSPDFADRERQALKLQSELSAQKKSEERKMQRNGAQMQHTIYLEIQDVLKKVCKRDGYTVILRFSRDEISTDPQKVVEAINRPVVFYRDSEDVTMIVLNHMNAQYAKSQPASATPPITPASAEGSKTKAPAARTADGKKTSTQR